MDACMLGAADSTFLQQAAHLTSGVYLRPKHKGALLQYLLVSKLLPFPDYPSMLCPSTQKLPRHCADGVCKIQLMYRCCNTAQLVGLLAFCGPCVLARTCPDLTHGTRGP